jgi:hypothetical protein
VLPSQWQKTSAKVQQQGYRLYYLDGLEVTGEGLISTIDHALVRAARASRLDPTQSVLVRENGPTGRVRAVAGTGLAWWAVTCPTCKGNPRIQVLWTSGSGWQDCGTCGGSGWQTDTKAAAAKG